MRFLKKNFLMCFLVLLTIVMFWAVPVSAANVTLAVGGTRTLTASNPSTSYSPTGSVSYTYQWFSTDTNVVTISGNGQSRTIQGQKVGTATIECKVSMSYKSYDARLKTYISRYEEGSGGMWQVTVSANASDTDDETEGEASGTVGGTVNGVTWGLNRTTGTLTVSKKSGSTSNQMDDYGYGGGQDAPWKSFSSEIKKVIVEKGFSKIGVSAFSNCNNMTSVSIPSGVAQIDIYAFYHCGSLNKITLPDSVTRISDFSFRGCSSLETVSMPDRLTEIGGFAFANCSSLVTTIPDSVTEIGSYAFYGCSSLTSAVIPDGVTCIDVGVFEDCSSLTSVTIPNSVTWICQGAFGDCTSLTSITIPNSVTKIVTEAFRGCTSLTSVIIPESVTEIGENAFNGCNSKLIIYGVKGSYAQTYAEANHIAFSDGSSVKEDPIADETPNGTNPDGLPAKENRITHKASNGIYKIVSSGNSKKATYIGPANVKKTKYSIPASIKVNGVTYKVTSVADNAFKNNKYIINVTIGKNVTAIGASAFSGCKKLKTVNLGANVTTIGKKAFYKCTALTKLTIPSKVNKIGTSAFYGCKKLKTITIKTKKLTSKNVSSNAFKGIYSKAVVKVPSGKKASYKKLFRAKGVGKNVVFK